MFFVGLITKRRVVVSKIAWRPGDRVRKLRELNFCCKCSFRNHKTSECRFKFASPCRKCKGAHLTYLCLEEGFKPSVSSNMATVHFNNTIKHDNVILPTFSVMVSSDDKSSNCRVAIV